MSETASLPLADTSDMLGLHQVFRDALSVAPRLVGPVAAGDTDRADVVGSYYDNVLRLLQAHHEGEDELMTPKLVARNPDQADTIQRIADQHHPVLSGIEAGLTGVASWRSNPSAAAGEALVSTLGALDSALTAHLDEEERVVLPIAAGCMNVAEWGELPGHGLKMFTGDKLWLILGLIQEQMTPEQVAQMEAHMPPPLLEFWTSAGRSMFGAFAADLRR